MKLPNFLENRTSYRTFQEVVDYINTHFIVNEAPFIVGEKHNTKDENQRAYRVIAYAILMKYTIEQIKALFSEHDHLCIALPHLKKDKNIHQINLLYRKLLGEGIENATISDYGEYFNLPNDALSPRK